MSGLPRTKEDVVWTLKQTNGADDAAVIEGAPPFRFTGTYPAR